MRRLMILIFTFGALAGIVVISINPVSSKILNLVLLGCIIGAWLGITILVWKRKASRVVALGLPLLAGVPFVLPGATIDAGELRQYYVQRMLAFEGTKYHWGGESAGGIDCSGLPRRALRDALLAYGIKHLNGRAFRLSAEQWWYDASARALGEGYRSYTVPLPMSGTIREMDASGLMPGDLAVTKSGVHVIAYAGNDKWVQADPELGVVATLDGRKDDNGWFHSRVTMHRWKLLVPP